MKKSLLIILFGLGLFVPSIVVAQDYLLDSASNGTLSFSCGGSIFDNGGRLNNYENNTSYSRTFCPIQSDRRLRLFFTEFNIHPSDRLEIYQGTSISGIPISNNNGQPYFTNQELLNRSILAPYSDATGCLTLRLVTDSINTAPGFSASISCVDYCQYPLADIRSHATKIDAQGDSSSVIMDFIVDTVFNTNGTYRIESYNSFDICKGDSIVFTAEPSFPSNNMPHPQSISSCRYDWSFGDGVTKTVYGNPVVGHRYLEGLKIKLDLVVTDTISMCSSLNSIAPYIRISTSKIRGIQEDLKICSGDVFYLSVGNEDDNTVIIGNYDGRRDFQYEGAVFIPDGPACTTQILEVPITIDAYPNSSFITDKNDILSVCTNMEHSFLGDLSIEIICPNGQNTILKHFTMAGGAHLGISYKPDSGCNPINNPQGIGWNYCYSNQLLDNQRGVLHGAVVSPIDSSDIYTKSGYFQTPIQNATTIMTGWETTDLNGFSTLIGCPINGDWKIRVCDYWGIDNGYLFSWGIEFAEQATSAAMNLAKVDSISLIGEGVTRLQDNRFAIRMPKLSPGNINYTLQTFDDFGCQFDTVVPIHVVQGPIVELGSRDTSIFEPTTFTVPYSENFTYQWYPTYDTTNTLTTPLITECDSIINYYLVVMGELEGLQCVSSDYIQVNNNPTPLTPVYLEGHANITEQESNIVITWLSNALTYDVYRNDEFLATATSRIYVDNNIVEGQDYCYTIRAKNNYCESAMSEEICKTAIGLNDLRETSPIISLYPNPTSSKANLDIKGLSTKADIQILDIQGRNLKTYTLQPNQITLEIDLTTFSKGLYNIRIDTKTNTIIKKIIKE